MNTDKIRKLIAMLKSSCVTEIEIAAGSESVRVSRHVEAMPVTPLIPAAQQISLRGPVNDGTGDALGDALHVVVAPIVGTFRRVPSAEDKPIVEIGQSVRAGDALCVIETLGLQTRIKADRAGTVDEVFVECGQPVEYDQPLFLLR